MFIENSKYNSTGNVVERYNYGAYGELTVIASEAPTLLSPRQRWEREGQARQSSNELTHSSIGNPITYTGQRYDSESGLYYYKNRYYSSTLGRFLTKDPLSMIDGPNLYAYVGNDPLNKIDSLGLWDERIHYGSGKFGGTLRWAQDLGFTREQAEIIARADNDTDKGKTGPYPGEDPSRHFNTNEHAKSGSSGDSRIRHSEEDLSEAIKLMNEGKQKESFEILGRGLHSVQDVSAHRDEYVAKIAGVYQHVVSETGINGTDPDDPDWNTKGKAEVEPATKEYLEKYLKAYNRKKKSGENDVDEDI